MSENTRRPLTTKVHLYQALYLFNRGFEITLVGLKRLEELGPALSGSLSSPYRALRGSEPLGMTGLSGCANEESSGADSSPSTSSGLELHDRLGYEQRSRFLAQNRRSNHTLKAE